MIENCFKCGSTSLLLRVGSDMFECFSCHFKLMFDENGRLMIVGGRPILIEDD